MGLDVYLEKIDNFDDSERREEEYAKISVENWRFDGRKY